MKVLLYDWGSQSQSDLREGLGHILPEKDIVSCSLRWKNYDEDPVFEEKMEDLLRREKIQICVSFNYFPILAKICHNFSIAYIAWIYDCPHNTLYSDTLAFDTNLIFTFDRMQMEKFRSRGISGIHYLPLAVNVSRLDRMRAQVSESVLERNFAAQIAFVGSLYDDNYYRQIGYLPPELKGYLDGLCESQAWLYGMDMLEPMLSKGVMQELQKYVALTVDAGYSATYQELFCDTFLRKNISYIERTRALERLARRYQTVLYSGSEWQGNAVECRGTIHYRTQMPLVFMASKLNLNFTIRSIRSGIPLRCLDIMGAGGALISNYQPELAEFFREGEEWIGFASLEELEDKAGYYLQHEQERQMIAIRGYQKVKRDFTYEQALKQMLDVGKRYGAGERKCFRGY